MADEMIDDLEDKENEKADDEFQLVPMQMQEEAKKNKRNTNIHSYRWQHLVKSVTTISSQLHVVTV